MSVQNPLSPNPCLALRRVYGFRLERLSGIQSFGLEVTGAECEMNSMDFGWSQTRTSARGVTCKTSQMNRNFLLRVRSWKLFAPYQMAILDLCGRTIARWLLDETKYCVELKRLASATKHNQTQVQLLTHASTSKPNLCSSQRSKTQNENCPTTV